MRIMHLIPGTGNFYCGSCLRDNALVRGLRARGHDVVMVPLYLPVVTEEPSESAGVPIFLGGINVFLEQRFPRFAGARWLNSPGLLRLAAKLGHLTTAEDVGELALSMLRGEAGHQAREMEKLIGWLRTQPAPEVICLSNSLLAGLVRRLKQEFHVPVVSSWQGEDSFLDALAEPYRTQAWQLLAERCADVDRFIAPSRYHGDQMRARLGVPADKVAVAFNGIPLDGFAPAAPPTAPVIGYLARMHHAKGLDALVQAFILLKQWNHVPGLRLRVAGAQTAADRPYVRRLRQRLASSRADVEFLPNLDRAAKQEFLGGLSVFCVPAIYGEAFGLYVLEALAAGVPVVQPRHGAFPELLAATGGGVLCEPGNFVALAEALERLLLDPAEARRLGEAGRRSVHEQFGVAHMTARIEAILTEVVGRTAGE